MNDTELLASLNVLTIEEAVRRDAPGAVVAAEAPAGYAKGQVIRLADDRVFFVGSPPTWSGFGDDRVREAAYLTVLLPGEFGPTMRLGDAHLGAGKATVIGFIPEAPRETLVFDPADLMADDIVDWRPCRDAVVRTGDVVEASLFELDANGNIAYLKNTMHTLCPRCVVRRVVRDGHEIFPRRPVETFASVLRERDAFRRERDNYKRRLDHLVSVPGQALEQSRGHR